MNGKARWGIWGMLAAAVTVSVLWEVYPLPDALPRLLTVPRSAMGFEGHDLPLTPVERAFFQDVDVLKRIYRRKDARFVVVAVDGTRDRHAVHDPIYCFRGAGWDIRDQASVIVQGGTARLVRLEKDGEGREVIYWFSDGTRRHASVLRYIVDATLRRVSFGAWGPEPVLVQVQSIGPAGVPLREIVERFRPLYGI